MGSSKATSDFRRRRKENLVQVCGDKCALCGYHKTMRALEFHHLDENQKLYGVGASGTCHSLEADLAEIKKCILVCANCHREIHDGFYSTDELVSKQFFDEEFVKELFLQKEKKQYFCKQCGKALNSIGVTGLCENCYKNSNKSNRPDRETLKLLIRTKPFTKIGEQFQVSDNAIRKWCKAENLPTKKSEILQYTDAEWSKI